MRSLFRFVAAVSGGLLAMMLTTLPLSLAAVVVFRVLRLTTGTELMFRPESFEATLAWGLVSAALGFLAALVGGLVCGRLGRSRAGVLTLAAGTAFVGILHALLYLGPFAGSSARGHEPTVFEALLDLREPTWLLLAIPLIDLAGILLGGDWALRHLPERKGTGSAPAPEAVTQAT